MCPLVDLEVLAAGEHLTTAGEGTGERLLPSVYPDVVHQLVLGLEGPATARTPVPETRMSRTLRPSHMLYRQMGHYLVHRVERLPARLPRTRPLYPQAAEILYGLFDVPKERPGLFHVIPIPLERLVPLGPVVQHTRVRLVVDGVRMV